MYLLYVLDCKTWTSTYYFLSFSYYELIISSNQLQANEFTNLTHLSLTEAKKKNLTYKVLKPGDFESNNNKILIIKETVSMVSGLDIELRIFGVYYLYLRAVISEKVI